MSATRKYRVRLVLRAVAPWVAVLASVAVARAAAIDWSAVQTEAADLLSRYVRIDTTNPPGDVTAAAEFLRSVATKAGLEAHVYESAPGKRAVVVRLPGREPGPAVVLLHHMDVVPAQARRWTMPPFSGAQAQGAVWGRGTLDDKGHGVMELMALLLMKRRGEVPARDVLLVATPDEEVGGELGARWLVENHWAELGAAVVLNEGGAGRSRMFGRPAYFVSVAEKRVLWLALKARGEGGHGSQPTGSGAVRVLVRALARVAEAPPRCRLTPVVAAMLATLGEGQGFPRGFALRHAGNFLVFPFVRRRLERSPATRAMLCDTVALTGLAAGVKVNVIPSEARATLDCRLLPGTDPQEFIARLRRRIADSRVEIEVMTRSEPGPASPVASPLFAAIAAAVKAVEPDAVVAPLLTTGGTDSRFFRRRGVPAYGLVPVRLADADIERIHGVDERLPLVELRRGCRITYEAARRLARALAELGRQKSAGRGGASRRASVAVRAVGRGPGLGELGVRVRKH